MKLTLEEVREIAIGCRSPCGERGLKWLSNGLTQQQLGRSPCGERGLKLLVLCCLMASCVSLPVRGAWVEMLDAATSNATSCRRSPCGERGLKYARRDALPIADGSLPVRGAWVEIMSQPRVIATSDDVAPRAGSVG